MVFVVRNLVQLVYVLVPCISHLGISQNLLRGIIINSNNNQKGYNTARDIVATAVLIGILRFASVSSSFSIHPST